MSNIAIYCVVAGVAAGAVFAVQAFMSHKPVKEAEPVLMKITAEKAKEMIDSGGVTVLDVRNPNEFAMAHIEGAILLPVTQIEKAPELIPDKSQTLLVHCKSGVRSAKASAALAEMGYTSVYDFGGIMDWPYETVK